VFRNSNPNIRVKILFISPNNKKIIAHHVSGEEIYSALSMPIIPCAEIAEMIGIKHTITKRVPLVDIPLIDKIFDSLILFYRTHTNS
jgi:hypothetical protein